MENVIWLFLGMVLGWRFCLLNLNREKKAKEFVRRIRNKQWNTEVVMGRRFRSVVSPLSKRLEEWHNRENGFVITGHRGSESDSFVCVIICLDEEKENQIRILCKGKEHPFSINEESVQQALTTVRSLLESL